MKASHIALAISLSCAALSAPAIAAPTFTVTVVGTTGSSSQTYGISDNGQAAGNNQGAYSWKDGVRTSLGTLGGTTSQANDLNNEGQIVGYTSTTGNLATRAVIWNNSTTATGLAKLGNEALSQATSINDAGQIVGYSDGGTSASYDAVFWNGSGSAATQLATLGGGSSFAQDINNSGQIVGVSNLTGNTASHAVLWQDGGVTDLGTLSGGTSSYAYSLNDAGQIVGYSNLTGSSNPHATLWGSGGPTDLGVLSGDNTSQAFGINENGWIVGFSNSTSAITTAHAVLWKDGVATNLNDLIDPASGWTLWRAESINDSGQIVGYGSYNGQTRGFLLTLAPGAVPEPASWAMMIAGFAFAGAAMRRQRAVAVRFA